MTKILIKADAQILAEDDAGNTAFSYAVKNGDVKMVILFLDLFGYFFFYKREIIIKDKKEILKLASEHRAVLEHLRYYFSQKIFSEKLKDSTSPQKTSSNEKCSTKSKHGCKDLVITGVIAMNKHNMVYLVTDRNKEKFSVKTFNKKFLYNKKLVKYALKERNLLRELNHPFIAKLFSAHQDKENAFLIMQHFKYGTLLDLMKKVKKMTEFQARFFASEAVLILEYLHKKNTIFRDLRVNNIYLDDSFHIKVRDFSIAKKLDNHDDRTHTFCGNIAYLAPEMVNKSGHDKNLDWYLLGILIFELVTGLPPFYNENP